MQVDLKKPRGILKSIAGENWELVLSSPSLSLSFFVEHYWSVRWDMRETGPLVQENLPFPSVHIVFEKGNTKIFGVVSGKFSKALEGKNRVFGIKFRPGAFYPFYRKPISGFTDKTLTLEEVFGIPSLPLEEEVFSMDSEEELVRFAEKFLYERLPEEDKIVETINRIIEEISNKREIVKVEDIVEFSGLNKRTLQRMFQQYVGVGPKWVINRYRMFEILDRVSERTDWADLALELGYFDQSHFIKDFKRMVGLSPEEYSKKKRSS
ncbi:AraC family transcriptional regulator [Leptospira wolffii]|uniref:helix-turn-helix domain-containing protein n=1 Tax=Leptospira wolffii TaxID=409998 RepID=UPI0010835E23|nr:AraC family transcriptional regulator [Leptospira wolffii]TGK61692.1 AraC family transcriptional regulator [Leptospira wolffii]TGK70235.1 AraC family transcriptional regulator [Leptospira wolffii]TGK77158.1 AraC family transcriptional regulator [Leptospira wolffii]TGL30989.1 AraC family transcriptional regulator [Leptospira wolffii]